MMNGMVCGVRVPREWAAQISRASNTTGSYSTKGQSLNGYALSRIEAHLGVSLVEFKASITGDKSQAVRDVMRAIWALPFESAVPDKGVRVPKVKVSALTVPLKDSTLLGITAVAELVKSRPELIVARLVEEVFEGQLVSWLKSSSK